MRFLKLFFFFVVFFKVYGNAQEANTLENLSLKDVKALILGKDLAAVNARSFINAAGVILIEIEAPKDKKFFKKIEDKFLSSSKELWELKKEIVEFFHKNGKEIRIEVPSQILHQGVLKLVIINEKEACKNLYLKEIPSTPIEKITDAKAEDLTRDLDKPIKDKKKNLKLPSQILANQDDLAKSLPKIPLKNIHAIVFLEDKNLLQVRSFIGAEGILIVKADIPGKKSEFVKRLEGFLNSKRDLNDLEKEIVEYFHENRFAVKVELPRQKLNEGILKLVITSKKQSFEEGYIIEKKVEKAEAKELVKESLEENSSKEEALSAHEVQRETAFDETLDNLSLNDVSALILGKDLESVNSRSFINASGVILFGVKMPHDGDKFFKKIEKKFLNSSKDLSSLKKEIINYFFDNGVQIKIEVPRQKLHLGVLKLVIIKENEFDINNAEAKSNAFNENEKTLDASPLDLIRDLDRPLDAEKNRDLKGVEKKTEQIPPSDSKAEEALPSISLKNIHAIIFLEDKNLLNVRSFIGAEGILIVKAKIPGKKSEFVKRLENFLNSSRDLNDLEREIVKYFYENKLSVKIDLPKQKLSGGVLKLVLTSQKQRLEEGYAQLEKLDANAQDSLKENAPEEEKKELAEGQVQNANAVDEILDDLSLNDVSSLVLGKDLKSVNSRSFINASGVILIGLKDPSEGSKFFKKLEKKFLNSSKDLSALKKEIINYYYDNGMQIKIEVPRQKLHLGILKLIIVIEKEVGENEAKPENNVINENEKTLDAKPEDLVRDLNSNVAEKDKAEPLIQKTEGQPLDDTNIEALPKIPLKNIHAIIFLADKKKGERSFVGAEGILIVKADIPGKKSAFISRMEGFLNSRRDLSDLESEVVKYFQENRFDVKISFPEQKLSGGLLKLILVSKKNSLLPLKNVTKKTSAPLEASNVSIENLKESKKEEAAGQEKKNEGAIKEDIFDGSSLKDVKLLVLGKDLKSINSRSFVNGEGVILLGVEIQKKFLKEIESKFLGSDKELSELKQAIAAYYHKNGKEVIVQIPKQKEHLGTLKLVIVDQNPKEKISDKKLLKQKKKESRKEKEIEKPQIAPKLSAILVTKEKDDVIDEKGVTIKGIYVRNIKILKERLSRFLEKPINKDLLLEIKHTVLKYYKDCSTPFVVVNIPEQNISEGKLKVVVFESKLGAVCVSGNKYFAKDQYKISLKQGDVLNEAKLIKSLNFINKNPFRSTDMVYKEGKEGGTTDVELITKEIRPIKIYYGAENTGLDLIGKNRFLVGVHLGNLFWSSQVFSYQLTRSFSSNSFEAHTMQYTIPLPWEHLLYFYGGFSRVHAEIPIFSTVKNKGSSGQGSVRYEIPLKTLGYYTQNLTFGFDYKRTNNSAEFVEIATFGQNVNLTQFYLGYEANIMLKGYMSSFDINIYGSPGKWLDDQSDSAYRTIRLHSSSKYIYSTLGWKNLISFYRDLSLSVFLRCQFASINLLPSEEFGIGGYNTVRAYDEREENGDNGVLVSSEIRLPSFSIFKYWNKKINDRLQFLGFADYGKVWVDKKEVGVPSSTHLLGIGPGLRYVIDPYLSLRVDYGWKLHRPPGPHEKKRKVHFGLNISF